MELVLYVYNFWDFKSFKKQAYYSHWHWHWILWYHNVHPKTFAYLAADIWGCWQYATPSLFSNSPKKTLHISPVSWWSDLYPAYVIVILYMILCYDLLGCSTAFPNLGGCPMIVIPLESGECPNHWETCHGCLMLLPQPQPPPLWPPNLAPSACHHWDGPLEPALGYSGELLLTRAGVYRLKQSK